MSKNHNNRNRRRAEDKGIEPRNAGLLRYTGAIMPPKSGDALRKVTLNLFEGDCRELETAYGLGWSVQVRLWIHDKLKERRRYRDSIDELSQSTDHIPGYPYDD